MRPNKNIMIKKILSICLFLLIYKCSYCQPNKADSYNVGFKYFKATDDSRKYIVGNDTLSRPMLVHFWYPGKNNSELNTITFKDYIDLIAIRENFNREPDEINNESEAFINAYLGFSKRKYGIDTSITTKEVLNSPVKAILNAAPINEKFPLVIYAPSNSKSSVQNHIMCEYLASNGYFVISVGSAGHETLKRKDETKATLAQVRDMEFLIRFLKDSLKINYSNIGLLGFSSGGMATIIYQINHPDVKAIVSLDGSNEYSSFLKLYTFEGFNMGKSNKPYLMFANNYKNFSIYPYYNLMIASDKYLFKMPFLDHNGFISYWKQFDMCSKGTKLNDISKSYDVLCVQVNGFFNLTLKPEQLNLKGYDTSNNHLIQKDTVDYSVIAELLDQIMKQGIEEALLKMKSNYSLYKEKENMINILGRMFIGVDDNVAIKLFETNTEIHPNSWESYYNLAYLYKEGKDIDSAKNAINRAKEINMDNSEIQKLYNEIMGTNVE